MARAELSGRPDLMKRCKQWSDKIALSSRSLLAMSGAREFYNPLNGKGQRLRVKNFGWSNLGYLIIPSSVAYSLLREAA